VLFNVSYVMRVSVLLMIWRKASHYCKTVGSRCIYSEQGYRYNRTSRRRRNGTDRPI